MLRLIIFIICYMPKLRNVGALYVDYSFKCVENTTISRIIRR